MLQGESKGGDDAEVPRMLTGMSHCHQLAGQSVLRMWPGISPSRRPVWFSFPWILLEAERGIWMYGCTL